MSNGNRINPDSKIITETINLSKIPTDGGYGWVIVFSCFMISLIISGIYSSFSILFVEFVQYFGHGKATTSLLGSLFFSLPLLNGPFARFCEEKWGFRTTCIVGAIISSATFSAIYFASSFTDLFICLTLSGFGLSHCLLASTVILLFYFDRKFSLVSGLSVCGEGIGSFIFPPLTSYLIDNFSWRGTALILGGILLNLAVCGCLIRDPSFYASNAKARNNDSNKKDKICISNRRSAILNKSLSEPVIEILHSQPKFSTSIHSSKERASIIPVVNSLNVLPNMRLRGSLYAAGVLKSYIDRDSIVRSSIDSQISQDINTKMEVKKAFEEMKNILLNIFDFKLFKNRSYTIFCISNALLYACIEMPSIYLHDFAIGKSIGEKRSAYLLSISGIMNVVGMILMGYLGDVPQINPAILYSISLCTSGIVILFLPFLIHYGIIAADIAIYNIGVGGVSALDVVVLLIIVSEDKFNSAYGMLLLVQGLALFIGSPLPGLIYDSTYSYTIAFYVSGITLFVSGAINLLVIKFPKPENEQT